MMTKKEAIAWYESLPDDVRLRLQKDFGNNDVPDRETKFYRWLRSFTKLKQKEYITIKQ
jgi:hypothetical protein